MRKSLSLFVLISLISGCAGINEHSYNSAVHLQSAIAYLKCGAGSGNSHHYAAGWKKGYRAVMQGADGTPPVVAPQKYWGAFYQCGKGHSAADDWFRGYGDGACAAQQCCGSYVDVPYSASVVGIQDPYYCSQQTCGYPCDPCMTEAVVDTPIEAYYPAESQPVESPDESIETKLDDAPPKPPEIPTPPNLNSKGSQGGAAPTNKPEENSQGKSSGSRFTMPPFESAKIPRPLNQNATRGYSRNTIRDLLRESGSRTSGTQASDQVPASTATPMPQVSTPHGSMKPVVPRNLNQVSPEATPGPQEPAQSALPRSTPNYELPAYDAADTRYAPVQPALPIRF